MGYNLAKKKMKKLFLFVVSLFCITVAVKAQDASGNCKMPGAYDYVNVDFYKGPSRGEGNFIVSNQTSTGQYITEIKVTITAEVEQYVLHYDGTGNRNEWKTVTLYDDKVRNIPANATPSVKVRMPEYSRIRNIQVSVGNLICKPTN